MREKDTNKFGKERKQIKSGKMDLEARKYAKNYDMKPKTRILLTIMLFGLVLLFVFNVDKLIEMRRNDLATMEKQAKVKQEQLKIVEQEERNTEFLKFIYEGDIAFEQKDYLKSVFMYRQATTHQPQNTEVLQKLILALGHSCQAGNVGHCELKKKKKVKLTEITNMK